MNQDNQHEQRTPEWFKARSGKITGSIAGAILGVNKWMSRADVMRSMVRDYNGLPSEFKTNVAMDWGVLNEDNAIAQMEADYDIEFSATGFHTHPVESWLGASPDGLIGSDTVAEVKCPYFVRDSGKFKTIDDQPSYYAQVQLEMYCTGRTLCYFYQWSLVKAHLTIIEFDQDWFDVNLTKLRLFYEEYLIERKNTDKYDSLDLSDDKNANDILKEYRETRLSFESITKRKKALEEKLHGLADKHGRDILIGGAAIKKQFRKGSVDYKKALEITGSEINPEDYRKEDSEFWVIKLK